MLHQAMSLETTIADITDRLQRNGYPNEQAISQGIVLRLLQQLGWDTFEPTVVWPEYQTGEGRADFALCYPPSKPAVVIEVKSVGKADGAVRQALQYAFHCGVPFVVLTDGRFWSFYLPAAQGDYQDRCICELDLFNVTAHDAVSTFFTYLSRENVASGNSLNAAQHQYHQRSRRSRVIAAMPGIWREIVELGNSGIVAALSEAVKDKLGYEPDIDDIVHFTRERLTVVSGATTTQNRSRKKEQVKSSPSGRLRGQEPGSANIRIHDRDFTGPSDEIISPTDEKRLIVCGTQYPFKTANDAMAIVFRELALKDDSFLERCAQDPATTGRTRRLIARTPQELYPHNKKFWRAYEKLPGGWVVATHLNNKGKRRLIDLAARLAGLQLDKDIIIPF
jgi:hypothetical protein